MADNRSIMDLPHEIFSVALPNAGVTEEAVTASLCTLSSSCRHFHGLFHADLKRRAQQKVWQAVIDDHQQTVIKVAHTYPRLLLQAAPLGFAIKSQYTHQEFDLSGETLLSVAVKRKQIKMIEILLSCLSSVEQTNEDKKQISDALSRWSPYKKTKLINNKDLIIIPIEFEVYTQLLISICINENFENNTISSTTEIALNKLFDILLPKIPQRLDDCIDQELFLFSLYLAYYNNFDRFISHVQRWLFQDRIIGFAQSLLSPETAKIFCEGFSNVIFNNCAISEKASKLLLNDDKPFYRLSRDTRLGMGFEYHARHSKTYSTANAARVFMRFLMNKDSIFSALQSKMSATAETTFSPPL